MNQRSQAISILQKARDALGERLTQRVLESRDEIEADAEGASYLSEIEAIYEQIGGRLAHLNAMLSNLPPTASAAGADATASEIVYADLASGNSSPLDFEATTPLTVLALPAPASFEIPPVDPLVELFSSIVRQLHSGDLSSAARLISETFDIRPSQARRGAQSFSRQLLHYPDLACRLEELGSTLSAVNEYAAATLLTECFEFQALDALTLVRSLKERMNEPDVTD